MTTAARPTYAPARGGTGKAESDLGSLSKQYSSRDLPAHTKLKYRQDGQNSSSEVKSRDFRRELEEKERTGRDNKSRGDRNRDSGASSSAVSNSSSKRPRLEQQQQQQITANLDADDPVDDEDDNDDDDDDDDDDDTAELLAELAKIKKERAAEAAQKESEKKAEEERIRMENILKGNPLINNLQEKTAAGDFTVKRRWDDDVVFKNCARGETDKKERKFINDTLRSEFHKKFMDKYIK